MNIKMNLFESIFHTLEIGENPELLTGSVPGYTLSREFDPRGETVRLYDSQYGRPICTIIRTGTPRPYLSLIHENHGSTEKYSFSMGFNTEFERTDNSLKYHLFEINKLVLKKEDAETYLINDIYAEDSMFQFSTVYNADNRKMVLLDKVHKQLSAMKLNDNYIFTGLVVALEDLFKE